MLSAMPLKSRDQRIRDEFAVMGPMTIPSFALHCVDVGIWARHELDQYMLTAVQGQIRTALKSPDKSGLPFAGQTIRVPDNNGELEDGDDIETTTSRAHIWAQRTLWDYEDYALNIREAIVQRDTLHFNAVDLADECRDRFGRAPLITEPTRRDKQMRGVAD